MKSYIMSLLGVHNNELGPGFAFKDSIVYEK